MGRRSGGGMRSGGGGFSRRPSSRSSRAAAAPPPRAAPTTGKSSMMGGLGATMMQGMAFGVGSEIAHQAVRGMTGGDHAQEGHSSEPQQQQQADPCFQYNNDFLSCLQTNKNDIGMCQSYLDLFKQCKGMN